jgi:hypothetical protein
MYTADEDINSSSMISGRFGARMQDLQARFGDFDQNIRRLAREKPLAVLGGAVVIGFVLGRMMSR